MLLSELVKILENEIKTNGDKEVFIKYKNKTETTGIEPVLHVYKDILLCENEHFYTISGISDTQRIISFLKNDINKDLND